MPHKVVDFWYEFASTYSYPAAMRIGNSAAKVQVIVRWRPFLLGPIFKAYGWKDSPFNIFEVKGRYMWRDLQRICEKDGLPLNLPPVGWIAAFTRMVFTANYAEHKDISDDATLSAILNTLGVDAAVALAAAGSPAIKNALHEQNDEAVALGLFDAPSFTGGR